MSLALAWKASGGRSQAGCFPARLCRARSEPAPVDAARERSIFVPPCGARALHFPARWRRVFNANGILSHRRRRLGRRRRGAARLLAQRGVQLGRSSLLGETRCSSRALATATRPSSACGIMTSGMRVMKPLARRGTPNAWCAGAADARHLQAGTAGTANRAIALSSGVPRRRETTPRCLRLSHVAPGASSLSAAQNSAPSTWQ